MPTTERGEVSDSNYTKLHCPRMQKKHSFTSMSSLRISTSLREKCKVKHLFLESVRKKKVAILPAGVVGYEQPDWDVLHVPKIEDRHHGQALLALDYEEMRMQLIFQPRSLEIVAGSRGLIDGHCEKTLCQSSPEMSG